MTRTMNINTIKSSDLDECIAYSDVSKISGTDYGTLVRALVYTMKKALPVEVLENGSNELYKIEIKEFSLNYIVGDEGSADSLTLSYSKQGEDLQQTMQFKTIGRNNVVKDIKSGTRTFYRYYIDGNKSTGYRFTFNRRISKD